MTRRTPFALLLILSVAMWSGLPALARQPSSYQAVYQARASGLSARAERSLEQTAEGEFLLSQHMEVRILGARLGAVEESSRFLVLDDRIRPDSYSYRQSGISRRNQNVQFNWEQEVATSSEDDESWQVPLTDGVVDKLSFQLLLRQRLSDPGVTELEIRMVDKDEVETHLYRVTGTEVIDTGLGRLDTLKVERIRRPGSERHTTFWLARDWDLLLVKFEQTSGSGSDTELLLEQATLAGQEVTPLP